MHPLFKKYGLTHLSISQVKTIKRSPFAWVCEKVLGKRGGPTEATTFGSFVHENFEKWLERRELDPKEVFVSEEAKEFYVPAWDGKVFKFWADYVELSGGLPDEVTIEAPFTIELHPDLPKFIGKVDVVNMDDSILVIQDHKTIGNKAYAYKTPETLAEDPQLNLYAHAFRGDHEAVRIQHNQLFKKIKKKPVNILSAEPTWGEVDAVVESVVADALEAIKVLEVYDELGIEGFAHSVNTQYQETIWDFGGCPHRDFHKECMKKYVDSKHKKEYNNEETPTQGGGKMPIDLHELVGKAREYYADQGLTKFDLADAVVEAVAGNLKDKKTNVVSIRDGEGGDLIYNQLLNRVAEMGISIYKKVR